MNSPFKCKIRSRGEQRGAKFGVAISPLGTKQREEQQIASAASPGTSRYLCLLALPVPRETTGGAERGSTIE